MLQKGGGFVYYDQVAAGRVIRRMRTQKHMTQELLSGFAGIARSHLSMIENGTKQANVETLWRIAQALEMKPSQLLAAIEDEIRQQP